MYRRARRASREQHIAEKRTWKLDRKVMFDIENVVLMFYIGTKMSCLLDAAKAQYWSYAAVVPMQFRIFPPLPLLEVHEYYAFGLD